MSIVSALLPLATELGLPMLSRVLGRTLGGEKASFVEAVVRQIAERSGIGTPELLVDNVHAGAPLRDVLDEAMLEVEAELPAMIEVYAAELATKEALLAAEDRAGGWRSAWRPLGMYFVIFLWFWQIVGLHSLNAVFKIALPPSDWGALMTFTGLYMSLYMGGHTVKEAMKSWRGAA